jgi:two-component system chemotaxis sensor kinase CheA
LVDELIGKQEVVIKALGDTFKSATGIAGGAILGDGRVGLILDLDRLVKEGSDGAGG